MSFFILSIHELYLVHTLFIWFALFRCYVLQCNKQHPYSTIALLHLCDCIYATGWESILSTSIVSCGQLYDGGLFVHIYPVFTIDRVDTDLRVQKARRMAH